MPLVPLYAALLTILYVILSVRTLRMRHRLKIGIGDSGNPEMLRAMRVHSNFAEYVPMSLLLIFFVELGGANALLVHLLAGSLLVGRLLHAYGVSQVKETFAFRVAGMALTFTSLLGAAAYLLYAYAARVIA